MVLAGIESRRVKSIVASNPPFGELAGLEYGEAGGFPNYLGIFKDFTPTKLTSTSNYIDLLSRPIKAIE